MPPPRSQDNFRTTVKKALLNRRLTVTRVAVKLRLARNAVSMPILNPEDLT